jgi:DNA mismatch endonuclease (patch repair protein)
MERALRDLLTNGEFQGVPAGHSGRMRSIKERGNKSTEARLRAMLVRAGIRGWKLQPRGLAGKPDFFFPEARLVVFVDGCYWHGCPECGHIPRVNNAYWKAKIEGNRRRDQANIRKLEEAGARVLRIWEHQLRPDGARACLEKIRALLGQPRC